MRKEGRVNLEREGRAGDLGEMSLSELPLVLGFGCGDREHGQCHCGSEGEPRAQLSPPSLPSEL